MTDEEIVKGCIRNDALCQRMLFNRFAGKLMSVCFRYTANNAEAEDLLQESFIKIFRNISQYRFEGSIEGWMYKIAVHTALKMLKKKKLVFTEKPEQYENAACPDYFDYVNLDADIMLKLVKELPEGYRIVFNLYAIEGYSHEEIAVMLNIKPASSRSQLLKARRALQEQIKKINKIAI